MTGAVRGIGQAWVEVPSREVAMGAAVDFSGVAETDVAAEFGRRMVPVDANFSSADEVAAIVKAVGRMDTLVDDAAAVAGRQPTA